MTSGKVDRKKLPPPTRRRGLADRQVHVQPTTATETALAGVLAEVLDLERVSVDSDFFDDLGASSLLLAHFCTRARERPELPALAMQDVYQHRTVRSLAASLPASPPARPAEVVAPPTPVARVSTARYTLCGIVQLLVLLGAVGIASLVFAAGLRWVWPATGVLDLYLRSLAYVGGTFVALTAVPILAKWLLVGRWKPQEIRVWSEENLDCF